MILFIHGFASCGLGDKSRALIRHFGRDAVLTPDLAHDPGAAAAQLEALVAAHDIDLLVGSSLGGHYATWLNRRHCLPAVLMNPAVAPQLLLAAYLGEHRRWCDGAPFRLTRRHLETFAGQVRPRLRPDERYLVLLQAGDELLDYRVAAGYYRGHRVVVQPGGSHRFENLPAYLPQIEAFRRESLAAS